jgi:hypothetical protein
VPGAQIIKNNRLMAGLGQRFGRMTADVSGSAGDEHTHPFTPESIGSMSH